MKQNRIKPIKPSYLKRFFKFLFYRQLTIIVLMQKFNCTRSQAKNMYTLWNKMKS